MRTLKYSITKILIYTISALLVYFLKTNVFAMSCDVDTVRPIHLYSDVQQSRVAVTQANPRFVQVSFPTDLNPKPSITKDAKYSYYDVLVPFSMTASYFTAVNGNGTYYAGNTELNSIQAHLKVNGGDFFGINENGVLRFRLRDSKTINSIVFYVPVFLFTNSSYITASEVDVISILDSWGQVQFYTCDDNSNIENKLDETNDKLQDTQDYLEDDNTSGANSSASGFFNNFNNTDHGGLSGIVSAPMRLVNALSSSSCSPLTFPLPFVNEQVTLPCMSPIYSQNFGTFLTLYRLITTGLIGYWVCIKLYGKVRAIKKPADDRIEVLEL